MASYDAQINILVAGQRNLDNLANKLNTVENAISEIERKWNVASAALQRANIKLGVTGTQQPRAAGGRFAKDPDRQARFSALADRRRAEVEQRLSRLSLSRATKEAGFIKETIDGNKAVIAQAERRIGIESRLNSVQIQFRRRLIAFSRGGGGANLPKELSGRINEIRAAYDAAGGSASRNRGLISDLNNELIKLVETQNEYNRVSSLRSKGFEAGRRLQEKLTVVSAEGNISPQRIKKARGLATEAIASAYEGDQRSYSEAIRKATAATQRIERESKTLSDEIKKEARELDRVSKIAPRSPVLGGVNFEGSPKFKKQQAKDVEAVQKALQQMELRTVDPFLSTFGISEQQVKQAGNTQRSLAKEAEKNIQSQQKEAEKLLEIERKIQQVRKPAKDSQISFQRITPAEAKAYYSGAGIKQLALPFGNERLPSVRGGARIGAAKDNIEILGGARTATEAEAIFSGIQEKAKKAGGLSGESFSKSFAESLLLGEADAFSAFQKALNKLGQFKAQKNNAKGYEPALTTEQANARISEIIKEFNTAVGGKQALTAGIGENASSSLVSGLKKGVPGVVSAATKLGTAIESAIKKALGIASPSRVMIEIAKNLTDTLIAELEKAYPRINAAAKRAFGLEDLKGSVKELKATNRGYTEVTRPSTGYRPLPTGKDIQGASDELNATFAQFKKDIAALTTQPKIYENLLRALPASRLTTDIAGAASRRATAVENLPSFLPTQRELGAGELEQVITREVANYLRQARIPNPWTGIVGDYQDFINKVISATESLAQSARNLSLPGTRIAGALPAASQGVSSSQQARIDAAYKRSAERAAAVLSADAFSSPKKPALSATDFGFMADPARISRLSGIGRALPPAIDVTASTVDEESRGLRQTISNLFDRISDAVRGAFSGGSGGRPPIPPVPPVPPTGGGGGGANGFNVERVFNFGDLAPLASATNQQLEILEQNLVNVRDGLTRVDPAFDRITRQLQRIGREQEARGLGATGLTRRFGPRTSRAISEGLIGGAFPLLFGQGLGASVGGLAGGAAGGFAGGGLGFGLSLLGTALGTAFDNLSKAAQDTGKALRYPIEGFEKLKEASLFASKQQEFYIQKLIDSGRATEAAALIQKQIASKIGVSGVKDLQRLGDASDRLGKAWGELGVQIQAILAGPLAALLEWTARVLSYGNDYRRNAARVKDVREGLSASDQKVFDQKSREITALTRRGLAFGGITTDEAAKRQLALAESYASRSNIQVPAGQQTPEQQEAAFQKARQVADEIKSAYREGFQLQQQAIDLQRQGIDLQRKVADEIFNKQQEVQRKTIEVENLRKQIAIETVDLEYRKRISNEEGRVAEVLAAEAELMKTKKQGEAEIEAKKRNLELDLAKQKRETENYIFQLSRDIDNIRRSTLNYEMQVADYRLEIERRIEDQRRIAAAAAAGGAAPGTGQTASNGRPYYGPGGGSAVSTGSASGQYIDKSVLRNWLISQGFGRTTGDYTNKGHETKNHMLNAMDMGILGGSDAQALRLTSAMERRLRATGAFGNQLFGPISDPYGHGAGKGGQNIHLHIPTPNGKIKATPGLMSLISGGSPLSPESLIPQYQSASSGITRPNVPMVSAVDTAEKISKLNAQDAKIRREGIGLEEKLSKLKEEGALQRLLEIARGEIGLKQKKDAISLAQNEIKYISAGSQEQQDRLNLEANVITTLQTRKAEDEEILRNTKLTGAARKELEDALKKGLGITAQQVELDRQALELAQQKRFEMQLAAVKTEEIFKNAGIRAGYIGEAAKAFEAEMRASGNLQQARKIADETYKNETAKGNLLYESYDQAATSLQKLATWENVAVTGTQAISNGFGEAFRQIAAGTASTQEILAGFFQGLANSFADMAAQMIANMIQMLVYKQLLGPMFGFNPGGGLGSSIGSTVFGGDLGSNIGSAVFGGDLASGASWGGFGGALGMPQLVPGLFASGGMFDDIRPFASGGMVSSPTLFKFADGGSMNTGVMGEAGPEAILPLSRGSDGKLGVSASGGGSISVTVNVDASGSKAQGDNQQANQLGKAVASAVQEELIKQKRPGGLLA